jgi:hypothetical protein
MLKRREFWFASILFIMAALPLFAIPSIQGYGRFMMVMNHNPPTINARTFASAIYQDATRPYFIMIGFVCAWFLLFGGWEVLLLVRKMRMLTAAVSSAWIFVFALFPAVLLSIAAFQYLHN